MMTHRLDRSSPRWEVELHHDVSAGMVGKFQAGTTASVDYCSTDVRIPTTARVVPRR